MSIKEATGYLDKYFSDDGIADEKVQEAWKAAKSYILKKKGVEIARDMTYHDFSYHGEDPFYGGGW